MVRYVRRFDNPLAAHAVCKHADPAHIWQGLVSVKHVVSVISMICWGGGYISNILLSNISSFSKHGFS